MANDIVKAVQAGLQDSPIIQALTTAPYIGEDAAWTKGWIFDRKLRVAVENSQRCAVVINSSFGWTVPNTYNTARFPLVVVDIFADPTRNADHSVALDDAETKARHIYDELFKVMHTVNPSSANGLSIFWGDLRITSSESLAEPSVTPVADGNGLVLLRARFGVTH